MTAYYNEIDPYAAQWLRNLIQAGHIAPGEVDERSIVDVKPDDLRGFEQCHFFAGIGGWSYALRLAGWPDDRPVWTGSCPCQPFSAAGAGKAADDKRHLWPAWFSLIAECKPATVFGEQVEAAIAWGWLDVVLADLEGQGYACGATVLPACSVGAPHIRNRLWFMAHTDGRDTGAEGLQRSGEHGLGAQDGRLGELMADTLRATGERGTGSILRTQASFDRAGIEHGCGADRPSDGREVSDMAHAAGGRFGEQRNASQPRSSRHADSGGIVSNFWRDAEWINCTDGKARPIRPGSFPLAHGIRRRTSKLRAYGNAIVPQVAAEFISAYMEI